MRNPYRQKPGLDLFLGLWFGFLATGLISVIIWAVITLVTHYAR